MSVREEIEQYIRESFLFGEVALAPETSFVESGILDSTSVLEIVSFLEERYGFDVEPDEINLENMDSLSRLEAYVLRKQAVAES